MSGNISSQNNRLSHVPPRPAAPQKEPPVAGQGGERPGFWRTWADSWNNSNWATNIGRGIFFATGVGAFFDLTISAGRYRVGDWDGASVWKNWSGDSPGSKVTAGGGTVQNNGNTDSLGVPMKATVPLQSTTCLGVEDRMAVAKNILDRTKEQKMGGGNIAPLSDVFLRDLARSHYSVTTSQGDVVKIELPDGYEEGADSGAMADARTMSLAASFSEAIEGEPSLVKNRARILLWKGVASKLMNQITFIEAQRREVDRSGMMIVDQGENSPTHYGLRFEEGGRSAILTCVDAGGIAGVNCLTDGEFVRWKDDGGALDYDIDPQRSVYEKKAVLRITLEKSGLEMTEGRKQIADGIGLEMLSYTSSYRLHRLSPARRAELERRTGQS